MHSTGGAAVNSVVLIKPSVAISFREHSRSNEHEAALTAWWSDFSRRRPSLFNGPLVACESCDVSADGAVEVTWYRTCYAHYLQRMAPQPVARPARALFCSIALIASSGRLVVGRMSPDTSSPNRLQLPGGNITLDAAGGLSLPHCAADACQELKEEVGISLDTSALRLWRIKVGGEFDDVGLIFKCRTPMTEAEILDAFELHCSLLRLAGESPELSGLDLIDPTTFELRPSVDCVDYLPMVVSALTHVTS